MNQPLAYVHPGAKIAKNVVVEPFTTIDNNVEIGEGTWVGPNVTIMEVCEGSMLLTCVKTLWC